ncbi:MAG: SDR family oxidoreductase [Candidatus Peribacteraceae bacterium]|nr:SDR family oxidoreductase [Candidatus Peribacteraceae bacterium]
MANIFITGGSGLLGSNLAKMAILKFNDVYSNFLNHYVQIEGVTFNKLDLSNPAECDYINTLRPDYIIHCAALTNLDYCEKHPDEAYQHNVLATKNMIDIANKCGSKFIFISTDSVFDGNRGNYSEKDATNPISIYAKTKYDAENIVINSNLESIVVRTTIFGWNIQNKYSLAEWMLNKLENKENFPAIEDIFFTPLLVNELATMLFKLIEIDAKGIIHLGSNNRVSKLEFAHQIAKVFELDSSVISPTSKTEMEFLAHRGKDTSLKSKYAEKILKQEMPTVRDNIFQMKNLRDSGFVSDLKSY